MGHGDLAIVERWLRGVNDADRECVLGLTSTEIEIVGPRGVAQGHVVLADWLARAGFTSEALRWFCGSDGRVVVEQDATWTPPGGQTGRARVASGFVVREQQVVRFERFETLAGALAAVGLGQADEVRARS